MHHNKHHEENGLGKAIVGLGAAAALIGTYLLYGSKKGDARRDKVKGWMLKMRGEVLEEVENLKELTQDTYNKVVDEVKGRYKGTKNVAEDELEDMADEIKEGWNEMTSELDEEEVMDAELNAPVAKPKRKRGL